jgi:hypothetical protein
MAAKWLKVLGLICERVTAAESGYRERKCASFHTVLGEVVAESALTDAHRLGRVLLHTAGGVQRSPYRLAFRPIEVLTEVDGWQSGSG